MNDKRNTVQEQLTPEQKNEVTPEVMYKTLLGRAIFGYSAEVDRNPYFMNDAYLQTLCNVQNEMENRLGKIVIFGFIFSLFSIAAANNNIGSAEYFGFQLANIPNLTEFCVLVMGVVIMLFASSFLDILAVSRMRSSLFSVTNSESANLRMLHMKGDSGWLDAVFPKQVGYSSGFLHRIVLIYARVWSISLPLSFLATLLSAQFICVISLPDSDYYNLPYVIRFIGVLFSFSSIIMIVITSFIPMRFRIRQEPLD
ncbi:hypothetical protein U5922_009115 [Aquicoccus sp. G2-2]|uniref:hypothetical protein n=1 Tax=Aquicoccus sp. G2-2 TaxID=3092120 RepID=UPI002ADF8683|nr:hypothetical protein [Aquicoccus sp. G2-2]MEA1113630.1 hypothetical protein [Aquicoccus sp. G2-2]